MKRSLAAAAALLLAAAPAAQARSGPAYLARHQLASGGFAEAGSSQPSTSLTAWAVMGLAAAGRHPARMHRPGGHGPAHFLASRAPTWTQAGSIELGLLAAVAMGRDPRSFGGRDLVRALRNQRTSSGRIGPAANTTYWGVLALRAAGARAAKRTLRYIRHRQQPGGGFGWGSGSAPDSNDTAAAIMALRSAGASCSSRTVVHAFRYLKGLQGRGGGYPLTPGARADSQSTAWAVAARHKCRKSNRRALRWLAARQRPSGAYNYRKGTAITPVWVTAQVLPATNGRSYPVRGG